MEGLLRDKTRKPGTPRTSEETVRELVDLAVRPTPDGETRWTVRALAKTVGILSTRHTRLCVPPFGGLLPGGRRLRRTRQPTNQRSKRRIPEVKSATAPRNP